MSSTCDYPHVTAILRDAGLVDVEGFSDEARDRGTAVHLATKILDEGDGLDPESIDPIVAPRLEQYQRFLWEVRPRIYSIEVHLVSETHRFQGTADRVLEIGGRVGILDIKGTSQADWHGLQLAAYANAYADSHGSTAGLARWNLYLHDTTYRLVPRERRSDWRAFQAALTLAHWREECTRT